MPYVYKKTYVLLGLLMLLATLLAAPVAQAENTSSYALSYCGNTTASGEILDCSAYTAAHPYLPFGTVLNVCWDECVDVVITDRGPCLDLSPAAGAAIGMLEEGRVDAPIIVY